MARRFFSWPGETTTVEHFAIGRASDQEQDGMTFE